MGEVDWWKHIYLSLVFGSFGWLVVWIGLGQERTAYGSMWCGIGLLVGWWMRGRREANG